MSKNPRKRSTAWMAWRTLTRAGGVFDLVVMIRVATSEQLADLVTEPMTRIPGIQQTRTLITYCAYARLDLKRMFSIGAT